MADMVMVPPIISTRQLIRHHAAHSVQLLSRYRRTNHASRPSTYVWQFLIGAAVLTKLGWTSAARVYIDWSHAPRLTLRVDAAAPVVHGMRRAVLPNGVLKLTVSRGGLAGFVRRGYENQCTIDPQIIPATVPGTAAELVLLVPDACFTSIEHPTPRVVTAATPPTTAGQVRVQFLQPRKNCTIQRPCRFYLPAEVVTQLTWQPRTPIAYRWLDDYTIQFTQTHVLTSSLYLKPHAHGFKSLYVYDMTIVDEQPCSLETHYLTPVLQLHAVPQYLQITLPMKQPTRRLSIWQPARPIVYKAPAKPLVRPKRQNSKPIHILLPPGNVLADYHREVRPGGSNIIEVCHYIVTEMQEAAQVLDARTVCLNTMVVSHQHALDHANAHRVLHHRVAYHFRLNI